MHRSRAGSALRRGAAATSLHVPRAAPISDTLAHPAFGQADLTNCERELIHLAGSIQPHGLLLVLRERGLVVVQASANAARLLGDAQAQIVGHAIDTLGGDLADAVRGLIAGADLAEPQPIRCSVRRNRDAHALAFEGGVHRGADGEIIIELEPIDADAAVADASAGSLHAQLAAAIEACSGATSIGALSDVVVTTLRETIGYDRVMVYKFDPDGHGEIIAEARDEALDSLLGHHYPATDIPQRARALYVRNRVRVLVDVNYEPVAIEPAGDTLDMSLCYLRSMSPLHLQYLRNMGVTATLVVSLVREGRLWGLIACHHYRPRRVDYQTRASCALLAEVVSTRITAIENYAHAQGVILVRALEQQLIGATATDGDWRRALFRHPVALLQPMSASGAALFFEGDVLTTGDVPSTPDLRRLLQWVASRAYGGQFVSASMSRDAPEFEPISATASGVLAVALSTSRPDYLIWFRGEQVSELTWAGDPSKDIIDNDPLNLSPRRSFAAWSQIVRGTASPWSNADVALAQAIGSTLVDIILQIQAVRLLIAQHQLDLVRVTVENSKEPVLIADAAGRILFSNETFEKRLADGARYATLDDLAGAFAETPQALSMVEILREQRRAWRGELSFEPLGKASIPVGIRADPVFGMRGVLLGYIIIFDDLTESKLADAARRRLQDAIYQASRFDVAEAAGAGPSREPDAVIGAILANARLAALDIADGRSGEGVAGLIEELKLATQRATAIYAQLRMHGLGRSTQPAPREPGETG